MRTQSSALPVPSRVIGYTALEKIGETLAPLMIRRRKADVVAHNVTRWRKMKFLSDKDQRRLTCALQNMRMACNNTYLLDHETDHGVKADEVAALFDDLFAQPGAKAVVSIQ